MSPKTPIEAIPNARPDTKQFVRLVAPNFSNAPTTCWGDICWSAVVAGFLDDFLITVLRPDFLAVY